MSDQPTDDHGLAEPPADGTSAEPALAPEQEEQVRRLLVDARELEPMPDSVVARLDRVLAELAAAPDAAPTPSGAPDPGGPDPGGPNEVTSLVAVRRQRAGRLLLAAAAVVVVGIGVGQLIGVGGGSSSGDSQATSAESQTDAGALTEDRSLSSSEAAGSAAEAPDFALDRPVRVDPDRFSADVERARRIASSGVKSQPLREGGFAAECDAADWGQGTFVPVRYDGDAGVLVFRAPTGDSQVVDLFQCGSVEVLRSITLPAP